MDLYKWYAVYTRSRQEKKVAEHLQKYGYTVYLPLIKTIRQWSDRKQKVEIPLISSYVFVNVSERDYYSILNTPGVVKYVTFDGKAAPIPENQILAMKMAVDNNLEIEITNETIEPGDMVKVVSGPIKGAEGELIRLVHKRNFLIRLNNIGFSLLLEVNAGDVIKL
ncbi:MAG: UpxY family transcription antiterminator [Salinivirgaceae bacterium]